MEGVRLDRRTARTRALLIEALIALIEERGYESITVQHIIDRANLGRSTFYTHFRDKEDLLLGSQDGIVHSLFQGMEDEVPVLGMPGRPRVLSAAPLFRQAGQKARLYRAMLSGRGLRSIPRKIQDHLQEQVKQRLETAYPRHPRGELVARFLSGSLLTLLSWWLERGMPHTPEEMDAAFQQLAMPGTGETLEN